MPPPSKSEAKSTITAQFPSGSQPPGTTPAVPDSTTNLLDSTPPQIVRALAQAESLIHGLNVVLGLLTWTSGNDWLSFFLLVAWWTVCLFGSWIIKFAGNFVPVAIIALAYTFQRAGGTVEAQRTSTHASLSSTLREIDILRTRFTLFLTPPSLLIPHLVLPASQPLLIRLCLAWPIWLLITHKILPPKKIMLVLGTSVLCWSAPWARITCIALWRSRTVRTVAEYILGQDLLTKDDVGNSVPVVVEPAISNAAGTATTSIVTPERPVRRERRERRDGEQRASTSSIRDVLGGGIKITQTLYQSQRRWIGIGWTSNLFPNERSAWADETEHPAVPINEFVLPADKSIPHTLPTGERAVRVAKWRWIDPEWNPVVNPNTTDAEGWTYTDNTWKNPGPFEAFGKYTRRRKFLRMSELTEEILPVESEDRSPRVGTSSPVIQQPSNNMRMEVPASNSGSPEVVRPRGEGRGSTSLERDIHEAVGVGLGVDGFHESSPGEDQFGTDI